MKNFECVIICFPKVAQTNKHVEIYNKKKVKFVESSIRASMAPASFMDYNWIICYKANQSGSRQKCVKTCYEGLRSTLSNSQPLRNYFPHS